MKTDIGLPRRAWVQSVRQTLVHMTLAVVASVAVCALIYEYLSQGLDWVGLTVAILVPMMLGGPMVFLMSMKQAELQLAYDQLEASAARDSLTKCFNHGAFVEAVTTALGEAGGALLVIDADHFKSINDRFGHASGDTALKLIVAAIRDSVGETGIVGRLGGEEFGAFLPGAVLRDAWRTAHAIRDAVRTIRFDTGAEDCRLTVSIGGAVATGPVGFGEIFRCADARLYRVKATGRDDADVVVMSPRPAAETAPMASEPDPHRIYRGHKMARTA